MYVYGRYNTIAGIFKVSPSVRPFQLNPFTQTLIQLCYYLQCLNKATQMPPHSAFCILPAYASNCIGCIYFSPTDSLKVLSTCSSMLHILFYRREKSFLWVDEASCVFPQWPFCWIETFTDTGQWILYFSLSSSLSLCLALANYALPDPSLRIHIHTG